MFSTASALLTKIRKGALILVLIAIAIIALDYFFRDGKLLRFAVSLYAGDTTVAGEWGGVWKVTTPDGNYSLEINEGDSSIRDNVFHSSGKWKMESDDSAAGMIMIVESDGRQTTHAITQKSADQITLAGGLTLTRTGTPEALTVSLFGKLKGVLNGTLIIVPGYEQTDSLYKAYLPVWDTYDYAISGRVMTKRDRFLIAVFSAPSERQFVVSIDTVSQTVNLGRLIASQGVQGECSAQFSIDPSAPATIKSQYGCAEGDPVITYYQVIASGDIVERGSRSKDPEYVDEGFWFAPSVPAVQAPHFEREDGPMLSDTDRNRYLESTVKGTSPDGGLFEYGINVIREQFIAVLTPADPASSECDWACALRELSGIVPVTNDSTDGFNHYNPEFVKWAFATMVPDPSEKLMGVTAQELYIKTYRRAARIYVLAYLELYHLPGEVVEYDDASRVEGFYGPDYLQKRYGQTLASYSNEKNAGDNMYLHPPQAFGFWLRRSWDNSSKDIWDGLSTVMMRYDPVWFKEKLRKYEIESVYNN